MIQWLASMWKLPIARWTFRLMVPKLYIYQLPIFIHDIVFEFFKVMLSTYNHFDMTVIMNFSKLKLWFWGVQIFLTCTSNGPPFISSLGSSWSCSWPQCPFIIKYLWTTSIEMDFTIHLHVFWIIDISPSQGHMMTLEYGLWYYFWHDFYPLRAWWH